MRVKFGKRIHFCTLATHSTGSNILNFTTSNGVYTVEVESCEQAEIIHNKLLVDGYWDSIGYEYSN